MMVAVVALLVVISAQLLVVSRQLARLLSQRAVAAPVVAREPVLSLDEPVWMEPVDTDDIVAQFVIEEAVEEACSIPPPAMPEEELPDLSDDISFVELEPADSTLETLDMMIVTELRKLQPRILDDADTPEVYMEFAQHWG